MIVCKIWFVLPNLVAFIWQKEKRLWFFDYHLLTCSVRKMVLICLMKMWIYVCCINLIKSHAWYHTLLITFPNECLPCNKKMLLNLVAKLKFYTSFLHSGRRPTGAKRPSAGCPECICNRPRPWSRPCVSDWGCGAVILLSRGEFGREKNKICYERGCVWTFCYMPNL